MRNSPKNTKWIFISVVLFVILSFVTPVLADYLGPNRTVTQTVTTCQVVMYECRYVASKHDYRYKRTGSWSCGNEDKPWKDSSGEAGDCSASTVGDTYWAQVEDQQETTTTYPPATINGSLQDCTLQNGWCGVTSPQLFLSASEPLAGQSILLIEGTQNGQTFACQAANCNIPLLQGNNSFAYWALSSWGDSSEMGMSTVWVDTVSPELSLDVSGSSGANGWYVSPTTVTAIGSDATSGLSSALLSVNGGVWQPSTTLNEGVYQIAATAADSAGNISNASTTISIDTTTPAITVSINGTTGLNGWYLSSIQVSGLASDATSGVGTFEVSADNGAYQSYISPISFTDGHHTIRFKAIDNAGNLTEIPLQEFYVDTIPPDIHLPTSWKLGSNVPYDVQDNGSGLAGLRLVIEDEDERYAKVAWNESVSGAIYSEDINWNGEFKDKTLAAPGTYLVWVKASDQAGNERIKLGKVIIPEPNVFLNMVQPDDLPEITPVPPEDLYGAEDSAPGIASPTIDTAPSPGTSFGGSTTEITETKTQSLFLTSGTAATIPSSSSNVLWGAAAAAAIGAATAYALTERRKREEAIAEQAAKEAQELERQAKKRARKLQKQQRNSDQLQAMEQARLQEERKQQAVASARIETKMARIEAQDEAKWTAAQVIIQKRVEEEKKKVEKQHTGFETYHNSEQQAERSVVVPPREKSWWEKSLDWVDNHQTEIALGIGVVAGVGAIILSGGLAAPLVAAAWVAGATVVAAGTVAVGTVALNAHYGREWNDNLLKNMAVAGVSAAAISGAWFIFQAATTVIGAACYNNQACTRVEPILNTFDIAEEAWLSTKLGIQTWTGNTAGAAETALELQTEHLDGGMPGNSIAKELGGETLEKVAKYGDEALDLVKLYGADAADIILEHGDEGIAALQKYGEEAIALVNQFGPPAVKVFSAVDNLEDAKNLLNVLDKDVLDYAIEQGPDAVAALSRWSADDLSEHGVDLALRAKKDAKVLADIRKLTDLGPIDPKSLTEEQQALINAIAENSTQYADEGQIVLGKWVDNSSGFVERAQDTGSVHYNPHPDMWNLLGDLGGENQSEVAWLVNKQVIQTGIDKRLPFEYTFNDISADVINNERVAVRAIFTGKSETDIMRILKSDYMPIRMKELQELQKAGYEFTFDEVNNSYVFILP